MDCFQAPNRDLIVFVCSSGLFVMIERERFRLKFQNRSGLKFIRFPKKRTNKNFSSWKPNGRQCFCSSEYFRARANCFVRNRVTFKGLKSLIDFKRLDPCHSSLSAVKHPRIRKCPFKLFQNIRFGSSRKWFFEILLHAVISELSMRCCQPPVGYK